MNYLINTGTSEEINERETDPLIAKACTRGLLINFNVKRLIECIRRMKV